MLSQLGSERGKAVVDGLVVCTAWKGCGKR